MEKKDFKKILLSIIITVIYVSKINVTQVKYNWPIITKLSVKLFFTCYKILWKT